MTKETMKIEKGISMPYSAIADGTRYPFKKMDIGDSFLIPENMQPGAVRYSCYQFIHREQKNWKFSVRKTHEGHRCWRIK